MRRCCADSLAAACAKEPEPEKPKPKPGEEDPDGMALGQVDQEGINEVVKRHQKGLFPCLVKLNKPGVMTHVPIEFTVAQGTQIDWQYESTIQSHAAGQKIPYHSGKALGGSSTINGRISSETFNTMKLIV